MTTSLTMQATLVDHPIGRDNEPMLKVVGPASARAADWPGSPRRRTDGPNGPQTPDRRRDPNR
jgi:hypothetical protein